MRKMWRVWLRVLPVSVLGVVVGHMFVYAWLFPHSDDMHQHLHDTGHSYFSAATVFAAIVASVGLCVNAYLFYRDKRQKSAAAECTFLRALVASCFIQSFFFVVMEFSERALHGGTELALQFFSSPILLYGLAFQLISAVIVAVAFTSARAIASFVASLFCGRRKRRVGGVFFKNDVTAKSLLRVAKGIRGPPAPTAFCIT